MEIIYEFRLPDDNVHAVEVRLDDETGLVINDNKQSDAAEWTSLDFHKCTHCPLNSADSPQCPAATSLVDIVDCFAHIRSYDDIDVTIRMPQRNVQASVKADAGARSLMGLLMASSGCPHLSFFRPMARFHIPFADGEETMFRMVASYFLSTYLHHQKSGQPLDSKHLDKHIQDLNKRISTLNRAFIERLLAASKTDTNLNALAELDVLVMSLPDSIEDMTSTLEPLCHDYLELIQSDSQQDG
jgi:hypothetical protein